MFSAGDFGVNMRHMLSERIRSIVPVLLSRHGGTALGVDGVVAFCTTAISGPTLHPPYDDGVESHVHRSAHSSDDYWLQREE